MKHAREDYNRIQDPENKIPSEEPVFLFRAQDQLACEAVAFYATLCEKNQSPAVAARARHWAEVMAAWPAKKIPDLPAEVARFDQARGQVVLGKEGPGSENPQTSVPKRFVLMITTAYEQGVGKGHQAYKSGVPIKNPYGDQLCLEAWQYGYEEGQEQAGRMATSNKGLL